MDLYKQYNAMVTKVANAYFDNAEDAEDAVQDVFVKLLSVQDKIPADPDDADPWIRAVATNLLKDKYRANKAREKIDERLTLAMEDLTDIGDPCHNMERDEILSLFSSKYSTLPPELSITLSLRYDDMLSYEEISKKLSIPVGTVASRISRAKQLCGIE